MGSWAAANDGHIHPLMLQGQEKRKPRKGAGRRVGGLARRAGTPGRGVSYQISLLAAERSKDFTQCQPSTAYTSLTHLPFVFLLRLLAASR
jgi:hypothetical protein